MYRYSVGSEWGDLFGLSPQDLELWQIEKISIGKLIEFATRDERVEKIVGDKIVNCVDVEKLEFLTKLTDEEWNSLPYLKTKYNECIAVNSKALTFSASKRWKSWRSSYVWWEKLSNGNRLQETNNWLMGEDSVFDTGSINFKWLEDQWLANSVIRKMLDGPSQYHSAITRMIPMLSRDFLLTYIGRIFELEKGIYTFALSNKHTPRKYVVKAVRAIAGNKRIPKINVELDESILKELPPVMRLKLLESLLIHMRGGKVSFTDIKTEEKLKPLLFGTAIKYNDRVQTVVQRFKYLCT